MTEEQAPITPRRIDRYFRWRGATDVSRLESFSDAVFAIVLALLFLRAVPPESFFELEAAMKSMVPAIPAFAITAYLWFEHWLFSRRYNLRDGWTAFLNLALLFLLLVYAYPLKYLFTLLFVLFFGPIGDLNKQVLFEGFSSQSEVVWLYCYYSGGYLALYLVFILMYRAALKQRAMLQLDEFELYHTKASLTRFYAQASVAVVSIGLAVLEVPYGAPGWCYMVLGPGMGILGYVQGRRSEKLIARISRPA